MVNAAYLSNVTITGDADDRTRFRKIMYFGPDDTSPIIGMQDVKDGGLLERFIPTPLSLLMTHREKTRGKGLDKVVTGSSIEKIAQHRRDAWGAPADVSDVYEWDWDDGIMIEFTTIESAPLRAFAEISERFEDLKFNLSYFGPDMAGTAIFEDGEVVQNFFFDGDNFRSLVQQFLAAGVNMYDTSVSKFVKFTDGSYHVQQDGWRFAI